MPFPSTDLRCRHAQTVRDSTSRFKIDYVIMIKNFLNRKGHQNPFGGSKVTAILLTEWIWPIGRVASGRVCPCTLRSRLVFIYTPENFTSPIEFDKMERPAYFDESDGHNDSEPSYSFRCLPPLFAIQAVIFTERWGCPKINYEALKE